MKRIIAVIMAGVIALSMLGCSQDNSKSNTGSKKDTQVTQKSSSKAALSRNGEVRSYLTGEWVKEEVNKARGTLPERTFRCQGYL